MNNKQKKIFFYMFCILNFIDFNTFIFSRNKTDLNNFKDNHIVSNRLSYGRIYSGSLFIFHVLPMFFLILIFIFKSIRKKSTNDIFLYQSILSMIVTPLAIYGKWNYGFRQDDRSHVLTCESRVLTSFYISTFYLPLLYDEFFGTKNILCNFHQDIILLLILYLKYYKENGNFRLLLTNPVFYFYGFIKLNILFFKKRKDGKYLSYIITGIFFNFLTLKINYLNEIIGGILYIMYLKSE